MTQRYEQRNTPVLDRLITIEVPGTPLDPPEFDYGIPRLGPGTTMRLWASRRERPRSATRTNENRQIVFSSTEWTCRSNPVLKEGMTFRDDEDSRWTIAGVASPDRRRFVALSAEKIE